MNDVNFDPRELRRTYGQFPTGVTVITTLDDKGKQVGVTASSFNSVSMDPPLVLWSVDKNAYSAAVFKQAKHFAVNILAREQVAISNQFASRGEDKFKGVDWQGNLHGMPLLAECAAQFECDTWNVYEGGDHYIIVGEVHRFTNEDRQPLVFARGSYSIATPHPDMLQPQSALDEKQAVLPGYLLYQLRVACNQYASDFYPKLKSAFDVSEDHWRVLSLLLDNEQMQAGELATAVMLTEAVLQDDMEELRIRGLVQNYASVMSLTEAGKTLACQLVGFAKAHEEEILQQYLPEQGESFKLALSKLMTIN